MAKREKKAKVPKGNKARKMGYVSFSKEDINTQDNVNTRAEEFFLKMLDIPKKVQKKVKKGKSDQLSNEDFYPASLEETKQMDALLSQAEAAVEDRSDKDFMDNIAEMREVIDWSKKRHWNFNWMIILGVLVSVFVFNKCASDSKDDVANAQSKLKSIEAWGDSAIIAHKAVMLDQAQKRLEYTRKSLADREATVDTISDKERKKTVQGYIKSDRKSIAETEKQIVEIEKADNKEIQKIAIKDQKASVKRQQSSYRWRYFWFIFFIILIPLYIFAERPYGYAITKYRTEAAVLGGIHKIGMALAGGFVGMAGALQVTETVTRWSDGSTTRDNDGAAIYALKIMLLIVALAIFCAVSIGLMVYSTIAGLIRNYDWSGITKQVSEAYKEGRDSVKK